MFITIATGGMLFFNESRKGTRFLPFDPVVVVTSFPWRHSPVRKRASRSKILKYIEPAARSDGADQTPECGPCPPDDKIRPGSVIHWKAGLQEIPEWAQTEH